MVSNIQLNLLSQEEQKRGAKAEVTEEGRSRQAAQTVGDTGMRQPVHQELKEGLLNM